jgi:hypothetical protein
MNIEGNGESFLAPEIKKTTSADLSYGAAKEKNSAEPLPVEIPRGKEYIKDVTDSIVSEIQKNEKMWAVMYPEEKDEKIKEAILPLATGISAEDAQLFFSALAEKLYHADGAVSGPALSFLLEIFSSRDEGTPEDNRKKEPIVISLSKDQTSEKSDWLGYRISGPITFRVLGNAGRWVGSGMENGNLTIQGNTRYETGSKMTGGKITVEGNTGDWLGHGMNGGEITVLGTVGDYVAKNMKNGILRAKDAASFDKTAFTEENRGEIWYEGIKIWENGKFTDEGKKMNDDGKIPQK